MATLEKQQVNNRFPKYLRDVTIAHKTGDGQPFIANDAGIIFIKDQPIVLVVLTAITAEKPSRYTTPLPASLRWSATITARSCLPITNLCEGWQLATNLGDQCYCWDLLQRLISIPACRYVDYALSGASLGLSQGILAASKSGLR